MVQPITDFGPRLRRLREMRGYSLRALARRAEVDATYLSRLESGVYKPPKVQTIHQLAHALELDAYEEGLLIETAGYLPAGLTVTARPQSVVRDSHPEQLRDRLHEAVNARRLGRLGEARQILERDVIPGLRSRGPSIQFAEALTALGDVTRAQRNYAEAEDVYLGAKGVLAEVLSETDKAHRDAALIYDAQVGWALAKISLDTQTIWLARQRIDGAWRTLRQLHGSAEAGLPPALALCAQVRGRVYWAEGHVAQARDWFDYSLSLQQSGISAHAIAETKMHRLLLLMEQQYAYSLSTEALLDIARDVLASAEAGPFPHIMAVVTGALARLYKALGKPKEARQHYRDALRYKTDDRVRLAYPDFFDLYQREMAA